MTADQGTAAKIYRLEKMLRGILAIIREFSSMAAVTEAQVLEALKGVNDPDKGVDIVSLGMVSGLVLKEVNVGFSIEVEQERGPQLEQLRRAAEAAVASRSAVS